MIEETGCDAVMIGRACIGNPWIIKECVEYIENNNIIKEPTYEERIQMLETHYNLLKEKTSERKALLDIKTHALAYLKYIPKLVDWIITHTVGVFTVTVVPSTNL